MKINLNLLFFLFIQQIFVPSLAGMDLSLIVGTDVVSYTIDANSIEAKVLLDDQGVYQIILKSKETLQGPKSIVSNAQFTLTAPAGGFKIGAITSHIGRWNLSIKFCTLQA